MSRPAARRRRPARPLRWLVFAFVALGGVVIPAPPAAAEAPNVAIVSVDTSQRPEVTLTLSVPPGTDTASVTVAENGRRRAATVQAVDNAALRVVVAVDTSGSMEGEAIARAREAAKTFIASLPADAEVSVVGFGAVPVLATEDRSRDAAMAAVDRLEPAGKTALYDAVVAGAGILAGSTGRAAFVLLSDGADTVSTATIDDAGAAVTGVPGDVFVVSLETPATDVSTLEAMIAGAASSRVLPVADPAALAGAFEVAADDLLNRLAVTYASSAQDRADVTVTVAGVEARRTVLFAGDLPEAATVPAGAESVAAEPGFLGSGAGRRAGAGLLFAGILATLLVLFRPRADGTGPRPLLRRPVGPRRSPIALVAEQFSRIAEMTLERRGARRTLDQALERAGVQLRAGEYIGIVLVSSAAGLAMGWLLGGAILSLILAGGAVATGKGLPGVLASRRRERFASQLADTLQLLASSLRAGHGLTQAFDGVAKDAPSPTKEEFQRVVVETRLGRDLGSSLRAMADRVGGADLSWFVQAVAIHHEVGGDLASILDTVSETIRDRDRIRRQVRTLSAEGRISAYILMALPFGVSAFIAVANPGYFHELFSTSAGLMMLALAGTLMTVGGLWLRKTIRIAF